MAKVKVTSPTFKFKVRHLTIICWKPVSSWVNSMAKRKETNSRYRTVYLVHRKYSSKMDRLFRSLLSHLGVTYKMNCKLVFGVTL